MLELAEAILAREIPKFDPTDNELQNVRDGAMHVVNAVQKQQVVLAKSLEAICQSKGHLYGKVCHNVSGHGHYYDCTRCWHAARGRHHRTPDPFSQ